MVHDRLKARTVIHECLMIDYSKSPTGVHAFSHSNSPSHEMALDASDLFVTDVGAEGNERHLGARHVALIARTSSTGVHA
jgi:hypothetical protein